jgi:hypothetical protein
MVWKSQIPKFTIEQVLDITTGTTTFCSIDKIWEVLDYMAKKRVPRSQYTRFFRLAQKALKPNFPDFFNISLDTAEILVKEYAEAKFSIPYFSQEIRESIHD